MALAEPPADRTGSATPTMGFVMDETRSRQQSATRRKLDEILQALPAADNALLSLEHASADELPASGALRQPAQEEQSDRDSQAH
jgi:low affinity Fe/Cu permease